MTYTDTLTKLSSARYADGKSMRAHISTMKELRERLAEMGNPINDESMTNSLHISVHPLLLITDLSLLRSWRLLAPPAKLYRSIT